MQGGMKRLKTLQKVLGSQIVWMKLRDKLWDALKTNQGEPTLAMENHDI